MAIPKRTEELEDLLNKTTAPWSIAYGDFMSNLMIFFLALFAFYMVTNSGDHNTSTKEKKDIKNPVRIETRHDAVLKKPYIEVYLKKPILLRYEKGKIKSGVKETLAQVEDEVTKALSVNVEGDVNKPERSGLYPANWVRKVVITVSPSPTDNSEYYVVKKGDNLWTISQKYMKDGILYDDLAAINNITDPTTIHEGDILIVPKKAKINELLKKKRGDSPIVEIAMNIKNKLFKKQ